MTNFHILFSHPWLMLLLIPALGFTLIPYFLLSRKYRRTRNRIASIALHLAIMLLAVSMLSGMTFQYDQSSDENELLLLVDLSDSGEHSKAEKDEFVRTVISECGSKKIRVGVVTFGCDQVYAAKLTKDSQKAYQNYLDAELPDDSATDIAAALRFASEQFTQPKTAKIVLISDGIETDAHASSVIKSIAAEGIQVDTVYFPTKSGSEIQLIDAKLPDYNISVGDAFEITLTAQSSFRGNVRVSLYDNDELALTETVDIGEETQEIQLRHSFKLPGLHTLMFRVESDSDTMEENNAYYSYIYLETFDRILVIERNQNEADKLKELLLGNSYNVTVVNVADSTAMPKTLDDLRKYDQVILVNIANADMPEGFDKILNSYVYSVGGGLLTVGGNKEDGTANAYGREDMVGTLFQDMLPVQAIDYTPPLGVMIIIDRSGSMSAKDSETGKTKLDLAKEGAMSCLEALSSRDWCGVMTLETEYSEEIQMTPRPQIAKIREAIDAIEIGGGTVFTGAIERAGNALKALTNVERRHIILITDGAPGDKYESYSEKIQHNYESAEITLSIVAIDAAESVNEAMQAAADLGHGRYHQTWRYSTIPTLIREDINVPEIRDYIAEPFTPTIKDRTAAVNGLLQENMPQLGGFYGTRAKSGADVPLTADYAPVYAQWKYGEGTVGSFMCDLNGTWSGDFLASTTGVRFLYNVIAGLFPTTSIRSTGMDLVFKEDNYTTNVSIYTTLEEGETVELIVTGPADETGIVSEQVIRPVAGEDYTRLSFRNTVPGIYRVEGHKIGADGNVIADSAVVKYKAFSYSKEYDAFSDPNVSAELMKTVAESGHGAQIDSSDPWSVLNNFVKSLNQTFDPRYLFAILIIVLFLLDIAVRKFKFKWPHELIRESREKKQLRADGGRIE